MEWTRGPILSGYKQCWSSLCGSHSVGAGVQRMNVEWTTKPIPPGYKQHTHPISIPDSIVLGGGGYRG